MTPHNENALASGKGAALANMIPENTFPATGQCHQVAATHCSLQCGGNHTDDRPAMSLRGVLRPLNLAAVAAPQPARGGGGGGGRGSPTTGAAPGGGGT